MTEDCLDHALAFVCRYKYLTPDEIYSAYQVSVEQQLLDRWHKTHIL
ncbi:hypothetical protein [Streptomyces tubercidicus]